MMRRWLLCLLAGALGCSSPRAPVSIGPMSKPTGSTVAAVANAPSETSAEPTASAVTAGTPPPAPEATSSVEAEPEDESSDATSDDPPYEDGGIDDDDGDPSAALDPVPQEPTSSSDQRLALSTEAVELLAKTNLAALGSLSLGSPAGGGLVNGVQMTTTDRWRVIEPAASWGTEETVAALARAVDKMRARFPDAPPLLIGHLSARRGGPLSPHRSHQSGRDVDIGYFERASETRMFRRARASNLDAALTWAFVRALVTETEVEAIFMGRSVQRLLHDHAVNDGEDPHWVHGLFQTGGRHRAALIRHVPGHDNHLHVRFRNPVAVTLGQRALPFLPERRVVERHSRRALVAHRVRKGETLASLARQFGTSVSAIRRANRLRKTTIVAGRTYLIPQAASNPPSSAASSPEARARVPSRRVPPSGPDN